MVRALVGDSTMTSARFPPRRAARLAAGGFAAVAGGAFDPAGFVLGGGDAARGLAAAGLPTAAAFTFTCAFGAAAFFPFALGVADGRGFDFFDLVLAIGPDLDRTCVRRLTRKIVSN